MSSQPFDRLHPVLDFAHRLRERLDSIAQTPLWSIGPDEQREALTTLTQAQAQLDALKLRGCSPRPSAPVPPPRPVRTPPPTGSRSRPGRSAASCSTSASPKHWTGTTYSPQR